LFNKKSFRLQTSEIDAFLATALEVQSHRTDNLQMLEVVLYCVVTHRAAAAWSCPVTDADDTAAVNSLK